MTDMNREKIHKLMSELCPNDNPESNMFLANYQKACRQFAEQLSPEEHEQYETMAREWMENKPPPEVQRQYVYKNHSNHL